MGKLLFMMIAAGAAGLAGWAVTEPFAPGLGESFAGWQMVFSFIVGACIGGTIGAISGWIQGSRTHFLRGLLLGALLGGFGGYVGLQLGGTLATAIFGPAIFDLQRGANPLVVPARMLVFVPFGGLLGVMHGLGSRSLRRGIQGAIGGMIGGAVGGLVFDLVGSIVGPALLRASGQLTGEVGLVSRAIASAAMGAAIGLFIGIVEILGRKAWVRLELGRNEGKEWIVDAPQTFIGRSESAHVPLFGDPNVMPMHACIVRGGGNYRLVDGGSALGIGHNGIRVPEALLNHGDTINIGSFSLRFLLRSPSTVAVASDRQPLAPVAAGLPQVQTAQTFSLVATSGPISGQKFPLRSDLVLGREGALAFDQAASRRHASFTPSPSGVLVRDLGSTNGTLVNGMRVQEMALRPGDFVTIGSTTFRLE
ncbi:MAG: FHA domain-containing protein [Armatimonadetes bacterium]|nr:FHA domain-containing protein [Armatimonadota bacterium]